MQLYNLSTFCYQVSLTSVNTRNSTITIMPVDDLAEKLHKEFGPLMGGEDLRRALGYRSTPAFARAVRLNTVGVTVFEIPGRRGKFAMTADVAAWLKTLPQQETTE